MQASAAGLPRLKGGRAGERMATKRRRRRRQRGRRARQLEGPGRLQAVRLSSVPGSRLQRWAGPPRPPGHCAMRSLVGSSRLHSACTRAGRQDSASLSGRLQANTGQLQSQPTPPAPCGPHRRRRHNRQCLRRPGGGNRVAAERQREQQQGSTRVAKEQQQGSTREATEQQQGGTREATGRRQRGNRAGLRHPP